MDAISAVVGNWRWYISIAASRSIVCLASAIFVVMQSHTTVAAQGFPTHNVLAQPDSRFDDIDSLLRERFASTRVVRLSINAQYLAEDTDDIRRLSAPPGIVRILQTILRKAGKRIVSSGDAPFSFDLQVTGYGFRHWYGVFSFPSGRQLPPQLRFDMASLNGSITATAGSSRKTVAFTSKYNSGSAYEAPPFVEASSIGRTALFSTFLYLVSQLIDGNPSIITAYLPMKDEFGIDGEPERDWGGPTCCWDKITFEGGRIIEERKPTLYIVAFFAAMLLPMEQRTFVDDRAEKVMTAYCSRGSPRYDAICKELRSAFCTADERVRSRAQRPNCR